MPGPQFRNKLRPQKNEMNDERCIVDCTTRRCDKCKHKVWYDHIDGRLWHYDIMTWWRDTKPRGRVAPRYLLTWLDLTWLDLTTCCWLERSGSLAIRKDEGRPGEKEIVLATQVRSPPATWLLRVLLLDLTWHSRQQRHLLLWYDLLGTSLRTALVWIPQDPRDPEAHVNWRCIYITKPAKPLPASQCLRTADVPRVRGQRPVRIPLEKMTGNYIFWDLMSGNYIFWDIMSGNYIFWDIMSGNYIF